MSRTDYRSRPNSRPQSASDELVDLHVYVVPGDIWRDRYNNLLNQSVTETISIGIIRVQPELRLTQLRDELLHQIEENLPREYVYLRSVGRSLTKLRAKQEYRMKVKHFLPPLAYAPELFLLEDTPDTRTLLGSNADSRSQSSLRDSPRSNNRAYNSYRDDYRDPGSKTYRNDYRDRDRDRDRDSDRDRDRDRDGYNDKYGQSKNATDRSSHMAPTPRGGKTGAADLQTENSSRMQRSGDRVSPNRQYSPIAKLDPSSPTGSRNASPERTDRSDRQYRSNSRSPDRYDRKYDDRKNDGKDDDKYDRRYDEERKSDDPNKGNDDRFKRDDRYNERDNRYNSPDNRYNDRKDPHSDNHSRNFKDKYEHGRESPDHERNRAYEREKGRETYRRVSPDPDSSGNGYRVLPPINNTPPRSAERGSRKHGENKDRSSDPRSATYTTNTNTDSGIADSGVSPEDQYRGRDNYEEEMARKRRELGNRLANDKFDIYDDDTYRLDDIEDRDQIDRERWERDREYRRQWIEDERRRREEEEARKKRQEAGEDDDDDDDRKKMKRSESEEELARYPSPPELEMGSPRETESAKRRYRDEKERLLQELESAREGRKHTEKEREELVKKAKQLQNRTQNRRNHARDIWKKKYFEEKKKTAPLEEQTNRLRVELDNIHRKIMTTLEGPKEKNIRLTDTKPSPKNNYVIQCTRLQHEIEDLKRRVENAKMKLTAEMKLRNQAEAELRALRAELTQKKINLTLTRNQQLAALNPAGDLPTNQSTAIAPQS